MSESQLTTTTNWRETIARLQAELELLGAELVDREAELAERLAAISAFEFRLRAHIGRLSQKLAALEDEIALLRKQLQQLRWWDDAWDFETADFATSARWTMGEGAASAGDYRYHQKMAEDVAPPALDAGEAAELKKHYRQLARPHRQHGVRAYRTAKGLKICCSQVFNLLVDSERLCTIAYQWSYLDFEIPLFMVLNKKPVF